MACSAALGFHVLCQAVTGGLFGLNLKRCVRCNESLKTGVVRHSCKLCSFHLCEACWGLWMARDAPKLLTSSVTPTTRSSPTVRSGFTGRSSAVPKLVPACKYGAACYQKSAWHLQQFAHPGDPNYRHGLVSFSPEPFKIRALKAVR